MISLPVSISKQPTEDTCGPTSLHAIYAYFGLPDTLSEVIKTTKKIPTGGTLGVNLAIDALKRGFSAEIYSYNLKMFDPSWKKLSSKALQEKLQSQSEHKTKDKLQLATKAYLEFLSLGGTMRWADLSSRLLETYLDKKTPLIVGLSATHLYQTQREVTDNKTKKTTHNDERGYPSGHFVVLTGYNQKNFHLADPYIPTPHSKDNYYHIAKDRVITAILLGILSYDGNIVVIQPKKTTTR